MKSSYEDALAYYGIGGAHPGGLNLTKKVLKKMLLSERTRVLDAGCGTGQTASYIVKEYSSKVTAIDVHPIMLQKAHHRFTLDRLPVKLHRASVELLPFKDESFDLVLSESVTAFTDKNKTLKEFLRVLKPAGSLLAIEMTAEKPLTEDEKHRILEVYGITRILTEKDWLKSIKDAGFANCRILSSQSVSDNLKSLTAETVPELNPSQHIPAVLDQILTEHYKLTTDLAKKLGYRVYEAKR